MQKSGIPKMMKKPIVPVTDCVNSKKNKEIPSKPSTRFKFKPGNQDSFKTNWKSLVEFWKKPNKITQQINAIKEKFKATTFNNFSSLDGTKISIKIPNLIQQTGYQNNK